MQIGYYDATCGECGETYNGYGSHSCPMPLGSAKDHLIVAAIHWFSQWNEAPRDKVGASLYGAIEAFSRAKDAEPRRAKIKTRDDEAAKQFVAEWDKMSKAKSKKKKAPK